MSTFLLSDLLTQGVAPMPLRFCGDPVLRAKSAPIMEITPAVWDLARRMVVTMFRNGTRGIGLAAPQVGVNIRLITVATRDDLSTMPEDASPGERLLEPRMPLALVNPEVIAVSAAVDAAEEGCLSVPDMAGEVVRPLAITLRALTLDGKAIQTDCDGLLARCVQHEIDHLDGILYIDRLAETDKRRLAGQIKALEKAVLKQCKRA